MPGITNPTEEYFKDGTWGWDGTAWRKLNLLWGYYDRILDSVLVADATAGSNVLTFTTVPVGQVWIYTTISALNSDTNPSVIDVNMYSPTLLVRLMEWVLPGANVTVQISGQFILKAGDTLKVVIGGCTLNDNLYAWAGGYKMKVL